MATAGRMATSTDAALLTLAQWFSPAFPVGAFSFSHGLERLVSDGAVTSAAAVRGWLEVVLEQGAGRNDLLLLAEAWRGGDLVEADALARALAPSAERLVETAEQGEAFVRTVNAVWGLDLPPLSMPVAVGAAARACALPLDAVARMYLQAMAANLVGAAVRIVPLGQTEGQVLLHGLAPLVERVAAAALEQPLESLGGAAFAADIASLRHETQYSRIFRS